MAMDDMAMMAEPEDDGLGAPEADDTPDEFGQAVMESFPENAWTPERLESFKTAIKLCLDQDDAGEYEEEKKPGGLALVFGGAGPKKKC